MNVTADIGTTYCPNYHVRLLFIYYAPNFEKVDGAYCFLSVRAWLLHIFVPTVTFKPLKLESLNFVYGFRIKIADP